MSVRGVMTHVQQMRQHASPFEDPRTDSPPVGRCAVFFFHRGQGQYGGKTPFWGVYYPRRNTFRLLSGSLGEATEHEPRCSHILLSKGITMLDIVSDIVSAIGEFFTKAIELVQGSITAGE